MFGLGLIWWWCWWWCWYGVVGVHGGVESGWELICVSCVYMCVGGFGGPPQKKPVPFVQTHHPHCAQVLQLTLLCLDLHCVIVYD